jgi:hypothetical protein
MNNTIARKIEVTAEYQPLAAVQTVATVTVSAPAANAADVYLLGDTGDDVPIAPGEWHTFHSVDLAALQVKGTAGDIVTVIGGTW